MFNRIPQALWAWIAVLLLALICCLKYLNLLNVKLSNMQFKLQSNHLEQGFNGVACVCACVCVGNRECLLPEPDSG